MLAGVVASLVLCAAPSADESWEAFPSSDEATAAHLTLHPWEAGPIPEAFPSSLYAAHSIGLFRLVGGLRVGFPVAEVRMGIGLPAHVSAGLAYSTMYTFSHEFAAWGRWAFWQGYSAALAAAVDVSVAGFNQHPSADSRGRFLTGRRNFNVQPGLTASIRGQGPRPLLAWVDVRYLLTVDTQPIAISPLAPGGGRELGHNVVVQLGVEIPLVEWLGFVGGLGVEGHGRFNDIPAVVTASLGLTFRAW